MPTGDLSSRAYPSNVQYVEGHIASRTAQNTVFLLLRHRTAVCYDWTECLSHCNVKEFDRSL